MSVVFLIVDLLPFHKIFLGFGGNFERNEKDEEIPGGCEDEEASGDRIGTLLSQKPREK